MGGRITVDEHVQLIQGISMASALSGGIFRSIGSINYVIVFMSVYLTEDSELRRTLQSLACGKARPVLKKPKVILFFNCFNLSSFLFSIHFSLLSESSTVVNPPLPHKLMNWKMFC